MTESEDSVSLARLLGHRLVVAGLPGRLRVPRMAVFGLLTILFPRAADVRPLAGIRQVLFRSKHAFCF